MSLEKIIKLAAKIIDLISISLKIFTNSGDSSLSLSLSLYTPDRRGTPTP